MKTLNAVTLCIIDCVNLARAEAAIKKCTAAIQFAQVKIFSNAPSSAYSTTIVNIKSITEYGEFVLHELCKHVFTSHVLIVQYDGYILKPDCWNQSWLQYDYIGAPWFYKDGHNVGNGGFSLRSKKLLVATAAEKIPVTDNEDHLVCRVYRKILETKYGILFAPEVVAEKFSVEGRPWRGQFGYHGSKQYTPVPAVLSI